MQLTADTRQLERLHKGLMRYKRKAIPFAARSAINQSAAELRKTWQQEINRSFITRNRWTVRSIQFDKTRSLSIPFMFSEVGSVQGYMKTQETGGTETKKGKHGVAIPTSVASREGRGAKPRRKLVTRAYRPISKIQLSKRSRVGSRKERFRATVLQARKSGRKLVFLELQNDRKGIFRVGGTKKKPKIEMLYDLSRPSIRIPKDPTLARSVTRIEPRLAGFYVRALLFQWNRHKIGDMTK